MPADVMLASAVTLARGHGLLSTRPTLNLVLYLHRGSVKMQKGRQRALCLTLAASKVVSTVHEGDMIVDFASLTSGRAPRLREQKGTEGASS